MDTHSPHHMRSQRPDAPKWIDGIISAIPFLAVVVGVAGIVYGLLRFLRGDETLMPIVWAIVVPIAVVPAGLGLQMLLVSLLRRRYPTDAYDAPDESSFL